MTQLKEQNGRYYQESEVVMVATNEKSRRGDLNIDPTGLGIHISQVEPSFNNKQHLYITSNEEIKEGDWFIDDLNRIKKCTGTSQGYIDFEGGFNTKPSVCKKIIATTDESIQIIMPNIDAWEAGVKTISLPKPSDSFISKYIEEYNKGNIIEDVLVEYEDKGKVIYEEYGGMVDSTWIPNIKLKVDSNNTITIKKVVEETYSREEVEKLMEIAFEEGFSWEKDIKHSHRINLMNNWIKENL